MPPDSSQNTTLRALGRIAALARRAGLRFAAQAALWKARTALFKRLIAWQERLGLYPYSRWIKTVEARQPQPAGLPEGAPQPLFSVLVLQPGCAALPATAGALQAQTYPHWEALAVCPPQGSCLEPAWPAAADVRFRPLAESPADIGAALQAARGDYVLALHAGDALSPELFERAALTLSQGAQAGILYSDEDQLNPEGARRAPFFKPDWSPELLLSVNYLAHALIRRSLLLQAWQDCAGEPATYDDLIYRCAEAAGNAHHLPHVLVHCAAPALQASDLCRLVGAHLQRSGLSEAQAALDPSGALRVTWPVEARPVSIIIPTRDHVSLLQSCLNSIRQASSYPSYEIILVDSGSQEPETLAYYAELQSQTDIRIVPYQPEGAFNFSAALNLGARHARGEIFVFLNNDTEVLASGWLEELVRWASRPQIGAVGALLLFPSGEIQHAGIVLGLEGHASHVFGGARPGVAGPFGSPLWYRNYQSVTGACLGVRRAVFEQIGGFDEEYGLVFSDIEIGLRLWRAGYRVVYTPFARLLHHEGRSRYQSMPPADLQRGYAHFQQIVENGDPFFNPNCSSAVRLPTLRRAGEEPALQRLQKIVKYSS